MKRLLRSCIECDGELSEENLLRNFLLVDEATAVGQLEWIRPEDEKIYRFVAGFVREQSAVPSLTTVADYFIALNDIETVERLKGIPQEQAYARSNFRHLLRSIQQEQLDAKALQVLEATTDILLKGKKDPRTGELVKGYAPATLHFIKESQKLRLDERATIHSDIRQDGDKVREEYRQAQADQASALGVITGYPEIDEACGGVKKGELWLHGAYTGQLKTTFALNWAYNAVTRFARNVVYISFEMPLKQVRRQIYTLHSASARFKKLGFNPLDVTHIQRGGLSSAEWDFYSDYVIEDFSTNDDYGILEVVHPDRKWNMVDIQTQLELFDQEFEISMVILDHGMLIDPTPEERNESYSVSMNSVVDHAKRLALTFKRNEGLPVVMLWQMSRTGMNDATKNDGVYDLPALNWASACEKSADVVTATFLNAELRQQGFTKFSHLKNRDNRMFEPFLAHVNFPCRKIMSQAPGSHHGAYKAGDLNAHLNDEDFAL